MGGLTNPPLVRFTLKRLMVYGNEAEREKVCNLLIMSAMGASLSEFYPSGLGVCLEH